MNKRILYFLTASLLVFQGFVIINKKNNIDKDLEIFNSFFRTITEHYVDSIDSEKLLRNGINAITSSIDPYTRYYNEEETKEKAKSWKGILFTGIGANVIKRDSNVIITGLYEGYGADIAGLRIGDKFINVGDINVTNYDLKKLIKLLKGKDKSSIKVEVERPGTGLISKEITRHEIKQNPVPYYGMIDNTAYIKFSHFLESSVDSLEKAIKILKNENSVENIIIDLRGNRGGLLLEAIKAVNLFISKDNLVTYLDGKHAWSKGKYFTKNEAMDTITPLALLTDNNSMSASEILAGAIQDYDRGILAGQKTFGKGLVQGTRYLKHNTSLYVTTSKYYTPSGRCIQNIDYSEKYKSGKVNTIKDSIRTIFYTKNKRKIYNKGGIEPDVKIEKSKKHSIYVTSLLRNYLFFDYVTEYCNKKKKMPPIKNYMIKDKEFNDFLAYVKQNSEKFETPAEKRLSILEKESKSSGEYSEVEVDIKKMQKKLRINKIENIKNNRKKLKKILSAEIILRFYNTSGKIQYDLQNDNVLKMTMEKLNNRSEYNQLLNN